MGYDAFISYSHSADDRMAPALQTGLQRLARPWYRRRALRVFRDETGLSVNPHLWGSIATAMAESRYFVLLASPDAAASPWVNREVAFWLENHSAETVLPVLTDGTLEWSDALGDFDPRTSSALPVALLGAFAEEPRYVDLRWAHGEAQLDLRHSQFRAQVATLAAPIHGVAREDLEGEDVRLHRRAMRLAWGAAVALVALTLGALVATSLAVSYASTARASEARAVRNADEASRERALALANAREAKLQQSNAESNAARAARNQADAETQRALAQTNAAAAQAAADEADQNAAQADANAAEAQANGERATANAARARDAAAQAESNAAAARAAADRADRSAAEAVTNAARAEDEKQKAQHNTLVALSRQLAAASLTNIDDHYDLALLEAATANQILPTTEAHDSLLRTLLAHPELRLQFQSSHGQIKGAVVSPLGGTIVTTNSDGGIQIWDAAAGKLRAEALEHSEIWAVAFGPEDRVAIERTTGTTLVDPEIDIVDTTTGTVRQRIPYPNIVQLGGNIAYARDGRSLFVKNGGAIDRWDLEGSPEFDKSFPANDGNEITLSADGRTFAWTEDNPFSATSEIFIRSIDEPHPIGPLVVHGSLVRALLFSPDGHTLESVADEGDEAIVFWNADTGARRGTPTAVRSGRVVAASPDQRLIAIDTEGTVIFEDARTGKRVGSADVDVTGDGLYPGAFTPDGAAFVSVRSNGEVRVVWLTPHPRTLGRRTPVPVSSSDQLPTRVLSPDGKLVADQEWTGSLSIRDVASGEVIRTVTDAGVIHRFSPGGDVLAFDIGDGVDLLDIRGGSRRRLPVSDAERILDLAFSPDGRTLAVVAFAGSSSFLRLWDVATATPSAAPPPNVSSNTFHVALARDGTIAVAIFGGTESFYEVDLFVPGQPPRSFPNHGGPLLFSPDGKTLAVMDSDGTVVLLSVPAGTPIGAPLPSKNNFDHHLFPVAFDGAGDIIAVGSEDGTIQLWDAAFASPIGPPLTGHTGPVRSLAFTAEGDLVSAANQVLRWKLDAPSLIPRACTIANRELTRAEWARLVGDALPYDPPCSAGAP